MADDVELTFLQDLAAHGSPKDNDLLLVNTDGDDKTLTLKKLAEYISFESIYPVGVVMWLAQNKNPNDLFPGSTWSYIGEDKVIRLAKADGSDLMLTGGSDTVQLKTDNLPPHGHSFSGSTSSFDYGTKGTSENGNHQHTVSPALSGGGSIRSAALEWNGPANTLTGLAGNHSHTVFIGAHSHSFSGNTANAGSGTSFNVTNSFIKLMGWYRSA